MTTTTTTMVDKERIHCLQQQTTVSFHTQCEEECALHEGDMMNDVKESASRKAGRLGFNDPASLEIGDVRGMEILL